MLVLARHALYLTQPLSHTRALPLAAPFLSLPSLGHMTSVHGLPASPRALVTQYLEAFGMVRQKRPQAVVIYT